ncbi:hypothetical protein BDZ94DRAFT_436807 [Collybia nuda]|uniref:Uncharacterized protein n=1 Tax=Collybia nuda TaxID=64659 RepID=A0A9P6C8G1_9AGAR|nr:hypothetical protein BDZ94DRAFT_436807 [Collybia nuda]
MIVHQLITSNCLSVVILARTCMYIIIIVIDSPPPHPPRTSTVKIGERTCGEPGPKNGFMWVLLPASASRAYSMLFILDKPRSGVVMEAVRRSVKSGPTPTGRYIG